MPSLRDQFHHFYAPSEDDIATAMKTGLIVPDTNVLLNLYRYQAAARDQLYGVLEKPGDRLWIPHQVGLEFHRRRLDVMAEQERYFTKARGEILATADTLRSQVRAFATRIGLGSDDIDKVTDSISGLEDLITDEVTKAQSLNEVRLDDHASDSILGRIDALFQNRVGAPMGPDELDKARAEAERRIREKIPPGYKDKAKADPCGDYLVWAQLIAEAKTRKLPVVLITDDAKEDWYQEQHGRTLGARRELREEMMTQAGVSLLIMTTGAFLHHAGKHLDAEVSQETVDQARVIHVHVKDFGFGQDAERLSLVRDYFRQAMFKAALETRLERLPESQRAAVLMLAKYFRTVGKDELRLSDMLPASPFAEPEFSDVLDELTPEAFAELQQAAQEAARAQRRLILPSEESEEAPENPTLDD